jgi:hypothetical protein
MNIRPMPCPFGFVEKNGLNSFFCVSSDMPSPVSAISSIAGDDEVLQ